jgi:hypothetical protein
LGQIHLAQLMVRVATIVLELNGTHKRARRLVVLPALALGCA